MPQVFAYDTLDRLTNGPLIGYTYGDSAHLHALTDNFHLAPGGGGGRTYSAAYDAAGNMVCRATDHCFSAAAQPGQHWATTTRDGLRVAERAE